MLSRFSQSTFVSEIGELSQLQVDVSDAVAVSEHEPLAAQLVKPELLPRPLQPLERE